MSKKIKKVEKDIELKEYSINDIKIGDKVYLNEEDGVVYEVLDLGNPFSLILNLGTNFAYLYKGTRFYK